eukprot:3983630-Pyramimonas_sp.AAC.1
MGALVKRFWSSGEPPCSASEALPGTRPRVPARVDACRKRSRTGCPVGRVAAANVDRRGGAPGRHHHRPASNTTYRALRHR